MAQAATFICLARALTDQSVINIQERVMEDWGGEKKWGNNREGGRVRPSDIYSVCVGGGGGGCEWSFLFIKTAPLLVNAWIHHCISSSCQWDVASRMSYTPTLTHCNCHIRFISTPTVYVRKPALHTHTHTHTRAHTCPLPYPPPPPPRHTRMPAAQGREAAIPVVHIMHKWCMMCRSSWEQHINQW